METDKNNGGAVTLHDAARIKYLSPTTAVFQKSGDFISACIKDENGEEKVCKRIFLHRAFPFSLPEEFISVQDADGEELGIIRSISDFDGETSALLQNELERKYYVPKIIKILALKEAREYSYWRVLSDAGEISFTLHDTQRSIGKVGEDRAFITDVFGSRYEIPSLCAFDKKSLRRIEIYL